MEVLWMYALLALTTAPPLLPNSALLVTAGILASRGTLDLAAVLLVVAGSALLGDVVMHGFGRRFSAPVQSWADRSGRRRAFLDWTTARIRRHGVPFVIVVRFLPGGRPAGALAAGVLRYPTRRYLAGAGIAEAVWATYSVGLGYIGSRAGDSLLWAAAVGLGVSALVAGAGGLLQLVVRLRTSAGSRLPQTPSGRCPQPQPSLSLPAGRCPHAVLPDSPEFPGRHPGHPVRGRPSALGVPPAEGWGTSAPDTARYRPR